MATADSAIRVAGPWRVAIGLGSNRSHGHHGLPPDVVRAAVTELKRGGVRIERLSRLFTTRPLGPSARAYANAVMVGWWPGSPAALLALCKTIERKFGRRPARRWAARVIDLDILAMDGLVLKGRMLQVPHAGLAARLFVLEPLADVWPDWRHPRTGLSVRQMLARLKRRQPVVRPTPAFLPPVAPACR